MTPPEPPIVDARRKGEFAAELLQRARAWIPTWELDPASRDFGMALLDIAARFNSEVAERLDRIGEKNTRGLLDWLGIRGQAARAARMPVVLRLTEQRREPVPARAPVKLRADGPDGPVVFETESDLTLIAGRLAALVAVSPADDAFYLPHPGIDDVEPSPPQPNAWRTRAFATKGANRLQLDPELGLAPGMLLQLGARQYRVVAVDSDIATLAPPLDADVEAGGTLARVASFAPFDQDLARNRQQHALYIGDDQLLDIEAAATIQVKGIAAVPAGARWEYWGKLGDGAEPAWQALAPAAADPLSLNKPRGAVEPREVAGIGSRWLRAVIPQHTGAATTFDRLELLINPALPDEACPFAPQSGESPALDGVANATPQVLDGVFYPFGREPRLFDTFYLGCAEAFSKRRAEVTMCFDLADPSMKSLTLIRRAHGPVAAPVLAAAAQDGSLHLFKVEPAPAANGAPRLKALRAAVQPPSPKDGGGRVGGSPVQLDRAEDGMAAARAAGWAAGGDFHVAVAARARVWVWHERAAPENTSGWIDLGQPGGELDAGLRIADLALVPANDALFALRDGRLYWRALADQDGQWAALAPDGPRDIAALSPVAPADGDNAALAPALCAVDDDGAAWLILLKPDNSVLARLAVPGFSALSTSIRPLALLEETADHKFRFRAVAASPDRESLRVFSALPFKFDASATLLADGTAPTLDVGAALIGRDLDIDKVNGEFTVAASTANAVRIATPFVTNPASKMEALAIPPETGSVAGAAVFIDAGHLVAPGTRSDALVGTLALSGRLNVALAADNFHDVLLADRDAAIQEGDSFAFSAGAAVRVTPIGPRMGRAGTTLIHAFAGPLAAFPAGEGGVYRVDTGNPHTGTRLARDQLEIAETDVAESLLFATGGRRASYTINRIVSDEPGAPGMRIVTLQNKLPAGTDPVSFWPRLAAAQAGTLLKFRGDESDAWTTALLATCPIHFTGPRPSPQRAREVTLDANQRGRALLLEHAWTTRPDAASTAAYIEPAGTANWERQLGETANNPELSWEYWNGSGWWKLPLERDDTANFQRGGMLKLIVPTDLQATEWAGKMNFWIRARLVGGDYGREVVTAVETARGQQIERDASGIHAPAVLQLNLRYSVAAATPAHLLTEDSATVRDQSAANRAGGAVVEAFVPLGVMLERLDAGGAAHQTGAECGCGGPAVPAIGAAGDDRAGRALYLGFNARLQGEQINLLFLPAAERNFDELAPVRVDVLRGAHFEPVVAADATRALGEAGIVSLTLSQAPEPAELFGQTLAWLRIRPGAGATAWTPALRGVYINAVWAQAAETQEFEMLASSEGAPFQQVLLARPPVLRDTLELRVREPLGEEERDALLRDGLDQVDSAVAGQPGDWVLWRQVVDPADEGARARVYALDEAAGVIRFGDGVHGAIPPIGRDAIMAIRYRRTDAGPAAAVGAGSALGIVTPVEGAEAAFAADLAAGGSAPEDIARVLRFSPSHLRQRGAAVTAGDLEDMALSLLPEAAQARCLRIGAATRMVLVMRGPDPLPARAVKRELRRLLLAASPPALAAPGAFGVIAPVPVPFHVRLVLATSSLDHSAAVAADVKRALAGLFDSAAGGRDGGGWRLGARPGEVDIAASLLDVAGLDAIISVTLTERDPDQRARPLRARLRAGELAVLAADGIELQLVVPREVV